jgi:hypothetical protein
VDGEPRCDTAGGPPTYVIDGANFGDFTGFVAECNRAFVRAFGGEWGGNLDAFNDYLWWGDEEYTLVWRNAAKSRTDLGHAAMADWLEANSRVCHPTNRPSVVVRLNRARRGKGPTLFDWLVEIIRDNEHVRLLLEEPPR